SVALLAKTGDDADAVGGGTVLAHLPLAFDALDRDLHPDDALDHRGDELGGSVIDAPGRSARALPRARQRLDLAAQPGGIVDDARAAPGVHRGVVPGRHHLAGLALGRIPGGRHVVVRTLEHDEALRDRS